LFDMLLVGLVAARDESDARWFDAYRQAPWSMLDIRDGGFTPWAGVAAALLVAVWQGWRRASLRKPLVLVLVLVWGALRGALRMMEEEKPTLPTVQLTTLAGEFVDLARLAAGRPMVVNLWAS
jgi:hypothetical protein